MDEACWICLAGPDDGGRSAPLLRACGCPRLAHATCIARWQLQQAGRREERFCRFCGTELADWRPALTPPELTAPAATPVMAVSVRGRVHKLRVQPGPEGLAVFKRDVSALLGYDGAFNVVFECKTPHNGEKVQLHGFGAFEAATHCAAVSAARRLKDRQAKAAVAAAGAAAPAPPPPSAARPARPACSGSAGAGLAMAPPSRGASGASADAAAVLTHSAGAGASDALPAADVESRALLVAASSPRATLAGDARSELPPPVSWGAAGHARAPADHAAGAAARAPPGCASPRRGGLLRWLSGGGVGCVAPDGTGRGSC